MVCPTRIVEFILILPMDFIQRLLLYVCVTSVVLLIIGMFKPWMMLWWEDVQNRRKVIKLYGLIAVFCYGLYWILFFFK
jgi:hypothetical protein